MRRSTVLASFVAFAVQAGTVDDTPSLYCVRAAGQPNCWQCAPLAFPGERPCASACDGQCVKLGDKEICRKAQKLCCESGKCEEPPVQRPCAAECGDPDGDGRYDRCLVPASCPDKAQLDDFFGHSKVTRPAAYFELLCGPLPASFPEDLGKGAAVQCGPANFTWVIHPRTMRNGSGDKTGPGLGYGQVRVGKDGQTVVSAASTTVRRCAGSPAKRRRSTAPCSRGAIGRASRRTGSPGRRLARSRAGRSREPVSASCPSDPARPEAARACWCRPQGSERR